MKSYMDWRKNDKSRRINGQDHGSDFLDSGPNKFGNLCLPGALQPLAQPKAFHSFLHTLFRHVTNTLA